MMLREYMAQRLAFLQIPGKQPKAREKEEIPPAAVPEAPEALEEPEAPEESAARLFQEEPVEAPPPEPDGREAGIQALRAGDYPAALEIYLPIAAQGDCEAQFLCGQLLQRTAPEDAGKALSWYKRAAKQGHLEAQLACAGMYEEGRGTAMNLQRALYWYEQAAKGGSVRAQCKCGYMYFRGRAETRSPKKARHWLEIAAGNGDETARRLLSERF